MLLSGPPMVPVAADDITKMLMKAEKPPMVSTISQERDRRPQEGEGHVPEPSPRRAPSIAAASCSSTGTDVRPARKTTMVQPMPFQMPRIGDGPEGGGGLGEPRDVLADDAQDVMEQPVQDPVLAVVEPYEDQRHDDPAGDDRQVVHEAQQATPAEPLVEQERCRESEDELPGDRDHRVADRRPERLPEQWVG